MSVQFLLWQVNGPSNKYNYPVTRFCFRPFEIQFFKELLT